MKVEHGGKALAGVGREDEVRVDAIGAARVRQVSDDELAVARLGRLTQLERPARVVVEGAAGARLARAAREDERADDERSEATGHDGEVPTAGRSRLGPVDEHEERRIQAASFGSVADVYERSRPGYPDEAVAWLSGTTPCEVVDLGAGTGKLTRSLVALGHRVTAVEPLEEMLAQLRASVPEARTLTGGAEAIPLPDASTDVVTCAQAFHWFNHDRALAEIARVLRPGGRVALVWNMRDESEIWVEGLSDAIVGRTGLDRGAVEPIEQSGLYGPVERAVFEHVQEVDRATMRELVLSRSYCAVLPEEERAPILERVAQIFEEHAVDGILGVPYRTECFRAARR